MEEDPKDHDFDQRHDGPVQRPTVKISTDLPRRRSENIIRSGPSKSHTFHGPGALSSPAPAPARHSTQLTRNRDVSDQFSPVGRKSEQLARSSGRRLSRDFDVRRDGPYGRPSLNMTRRKSSGMGLPPSAAVAAAAGGADEQAVHSPTLESAVVDESGQAGEQLPASLETLQSSDPAFEPEPPPLNYSLWERKWSILFFWSLILIDSIAMPISLYFGLWYGTNLSPNTVFSIVTAALGGVAILEYTLRFWRLWKKGSTCRVIGARRMYLDWFHWNFSIAWVVIVVELIVGTIPTHPPIRLLAMPLASMLYITGLELLVVDVLRYFEIPAPIRVSSIPKGSQLRPGIYSVIEDICAVDGSGNTEFREALNRRYEASHIFRAMLRRLGAYWAFGAVAAATVTTILVFTIQHEAAYVVGWSVPFIWAGIWTLGTFWYVKKKLREEKKAWAEEVAAKSQA